MTNKLRHWLIVAFIILVPLCYLPNYTRDAQEDFFQYAAMILVAGFVGNIWLGSFMALNVVLYIYNGASVGNSQVLNVMFGCLIFMFSRYFFKTNRFEEVSRYLLIVVAVTVFFMMMQLFHLGWLFYPQDNGGTVEMGQMGDPVGFFGIKEANGTFLTIAWPIVMGFNPILGLMLSVPIMLSQSSSVYLAFMTVLLFYTYYSYRRFFKWLLLAIPIIAIIFIFGDLKTDPKTFKSRFPVWHSTIEYALRKPWGYGPDSYRNYTRHKNFMFISDSQYNHAIEFKTDAGEKQFKYYSPSRDKEKLISMGKRLVTEGPKKDEMATWDNPHSMVINLLFQYGILGVLLLLGLMREMYFRFKYCIKDQETVIVTSCLLVYFVTGIGQFPLELARTGYLAPLLLGAFFAKTDGN